MAQGTAQADSPSPVEARGAKLVQYEHYIDQQVAKTRNNVKLVELAGHAMTLAAVTCGFLLGAAILDHWLVPGGLGFTGRLLLLAGLTTGAVWYVVKRVVPLLAHRISPEFAAQTIESSAASLKNSLLNFLMLRHDRAGVQPAVYEVVEQQAATRLAGVPVESAVDRTHLIRVGYVLLAVVVFGCLYKVISPKDPLVTAGRIILPWANIAPSTRVQILDVQPGTATLSRGTQVTVSADVRNLDSDQPVRLFYTTAGEQAVDQRVEMHVPAGQSRFECLLGSRAAGVREDLSYRLEAGDAISPTFRIRVTPAPTILVERIEYHYPPYTGMSTQTVQREGDIVALEGTRVTIHAQANGPIDTARVDFDCDGRSDRRMKASGDRATTSFLLRLTPDQHATLPATDGGSDSPSGAVSTVAPRTPRRGTYQILFANEAGQENLRPIEYQLEVIPDLAPEVELLAPAEDQLDVPLDGSVEFEVRANDPDFALQKVVLQAAVGPRSVWQKPLLDQVQTGQMVGRLSFQPSRHEVKVGDVVEIWATATDNKMPEPNARETARKRLRITPGQQAQPKPGQQGENGNPTDDQAADGQDDTPPSDDGSQQDGPAGRQSEQGKQGDQGDQGEQGDQAEGPAGEKPSESEPDGGGQQGQDQSESGGKGGKSQGQGPAGGDQQETGESQDGSSTGKKDGAAGQSAGEGDQDGSAQDSSSSGVENPGGGQSAAGKAGRSKPTDGNPSGEQGADGGVSSDGSDDGSAFDEMLERIQQATGSGKKDAGKDAEDDKDAEGGKPDGTSADGTSADGQSADGQSADGQSADGQSADGGPPEPSRSDERSAEESQSDDREGSKGSDGQGRSAPGEEKGPAEKTPGEGGAEADNRSEAAPSGSQGKGRTDPQNGPPPKPKSAQPPRGQGAEPPDTGPGASAQSPADGSSQSDSQGEQGGDKPGGGESGGGQDSDRQGTGSAGQNTPADQGAGQTGETGRGQPSSSAGQDTPSDRPTGSPGSQQPGSGGRRGAASPNGKSPTGDKPSQSGAPSQAGAPAAAGPGQPDGGGRPANAGSATTPPGALPPGDEVNLEYAKKATGLVLERLKDQINKDKVDQGLLDKLGWSQDDLKRFVSRWEKMYEKTQLPGAQGVAARQELDETLRSLGLNRARISQRAGQRDDSMKQLRESLRSSPPAEYQQQLRAYLKGTSRLAAPRAD